MDWSSIEQNWKQFRRNIKQKWVKLSDEDLTEINGRRELLESLKPSRNPPRSMPTLSRAQTKSSERPQAQTSF